MDIQITTLNDPKIKDKIRKAAKDISDQWTVIEGYRATVSESFKALSEETEIPLRMLRKLVRAHHNQAFEEEVQEADDFEIIYEKIFKEDI